MARPARRWAAALTPRAIPAVQVATYYHDIKRMDDAKVEGGDEVCALHIVGTPVRGAPWVLRTYRNVSACACRAWERPATLC